MRKFVLFAIIVALLASTALTVYAAPPEDGPPGLERAIAAQEAHTDAMLAIPGVIGTAVGLRGDGEPVVKIYTKSGKIAGFPKELDGVPVLVQVTGEIVALDKPENPGGKGRGRNKAPVANDQNVMIAANTPITITLTGSNKNGCVDPEFMFTITLPGSTNGSLVPTNGNMTCDGGYLTADVQYTPNSNNIADSFKFKITQGDMVSNEATVSIIVGTPLSRYDRPADIGVSSGSERLIRIRGGWWCTVGTLGVRLTDGTDVYALSNNHVYALEGKGEIGDWILQPGRVDMTDQACGSTAEINEAIIGYLYDYVPIQFSRKAHNKVDAAVAYTTTAMVGRSTPLATGYGIPSSATLPATEDLLELEVQKHGRTTALTTGRITGINATILVKYDSGTARFDGQIEVTRPDGSPFSEGGDSGSLIVTCNGVNPVALLFAGGETLDGDKVSFGNPIDDVLSELSAELGVTLSIDGS